MTVSIGLATGLGADREGAEALYSAADVALYEEGRGRNQTRCATFPDAAAVTLRLVGT